MRHFGFIDIQMLCKSIKIAEISITQLIIFNYNFQMQAEQLSRNSSKGFIFRQMYTHSQNQSLQNSIEKTSHRKSSCPKSNNFLNMDKLIDDVKITQIKQNKYAVHIQNIMRQLQALKGFPFIKEQICIIEILVDTINKKVFSGSMTYETRKNVQNSAENQIFKQSNYNIQDSSPLADCPDGASIFNTKFSLKQMRTLSCRHSLTCNNSKSNLPTPKNASFFQQKPNKDIQKSNNQILALQKILKSKQLNELSRVHNVFNGVEINRRNVCNSSREVPNYKQSETLCSAFKKGQTQISKSNNQKNKTPYSREGKIKITQSKYR